MSEKIKVEELNAVINGVLENYNSAIVKGVKQNVRKAMKDLVNETKATAPVGRSKNHYKDNITSRTVENTDTSLIMEWYVKDPKYRISHLIEKGHKSKNGGNVKGYGFIAKSLKKVETSYESKIEEVIKNAK